MKRSDMLLKITNLMMMGTSELNTYTYNSYQQLAEDMLTCIEEAGMLPPYNPQHLDHGAMQDCQWDPEETICEIPEYAYKCNNCKCED